MKKIHLQYFALLREERGLSTEHLTTNAATAEDLYLELQKKYRFSLSTQLLKVAINEEFKAWSTKLKNGDQVVFIPPVAGG